MRKAFSLLLALLLASTVGVGAEGQSAASRGGDVYDVLRIFAEHAGMSIVIDPSVKHFPVYYRIVGSDDRTILSAILRAYGLAGVEVDHVFYVATPNVLATRYRGSASGVLEVPRDASASATADCLRPLVPAGSLLLPNDETHTVLVQSTPDVVSSAKTLVANGDCPQQTAVIAMQYGSDASLILQSLKLAVPPTFDSLAFVQPTSNSIILRGRRAYVAAARNFIALVDRPGVQVLYSVSVIEIVPRNDTRNQGIQIGGITVGGNNSAATAGIPLVSNAVQINANLNALASTGEARVLQRMTLLTTNGVAGVTQFGTDIPIQVNNQITGVGSVQTVNAGVQLSATPMVGTNELVTQLVTTYSEQTGSSVNGYPQLARRSDSATVISHPDDAILIAGLYADTHTSTYQKAPPFSSLPIFGGLFRNHSGADQHDEVVMILSPHVFDLARRDLPVSFPNVDPSLIHNGIAPAPVPTGGPQ